MHIVCHAAGCRLGSQGLKEVCVLFREALQLTVCLCFVTSLYIFAAVSLRLKTTLTARWAIFIVFKIIRPSHHYERGCNIGYAIWISIGCHASYPMRWRQAAFPTHMQSVMSHLSFDEENKVWGILHSDRCEMKFPHSATIWSAFSVLISNQRLNFTSKRLCLVDAVALIYKE